MKFKIRTFFITSMLTEFYVRVAILLTCRIHHFTKRGGWCPKTSLTPSLFIEVPVPRQESERSCIRCVYFDFVSRTFQLYFRTVPTEWYFWYFIVFMHHSVYRDLSIGYCCGLFKVG